MKITYYTRHVDDGQGRQNVTAIDGIITAQELVARSGYYTGDGNPELVGKPVKVLRAMNFRQVRGPQAWNQFLQRWISLDPDLYSLWEKEV